MDKFKKARAALRTSVTLRVAQIETEIAKESADLDKIGAVIEVLVNKQAALVDLDAKIYDLLLESKEIDDAVLEKELEEQDEYLVKCYGIKLRVTKLEKRPTSCVLNNSVADNKRPYKLPQLELKKFSGELEEWLPFWTQFCKIHDDVSLEEGDKFQYLIQSTVLGSRARNLVESFPATAENYAKAVECLKARYGREDLLVEVYVRELLKLVLRNTLSHEKTSLSTLYDNLESKLRALETLHVTTARCAAMLMPLVESCLPEEVLRVWQRSSFCVQAEFNQIDEEHSTPQNRLEQLMKFLRTELENEEKIKLALTGFKVEDRCRLKESDKNRCHMKPSFTRKIATATGLFSTIKETGCVFCGNNHSDSECTKAQKMTIKERQLVLNKKRCCYNCLKIGHQASSCWNKSRCVICARKHNVLMCENLSQSRNFGSQQLKADIENRANNETANSYEKTLTNIEKSPKVLLQTLIVRLRGNDCARTVRALIDSASQRSYISQSVAAEMKYEPVRQEKVQHSLFGGVNTSIVKHNVYRIHLSDVDDKYKCNFEVLDQKVICDKIPSIKKELVTTEMKNYNITLTDFEDKPIEILIGADVCGKLFTGKKQLLSNGLVAIETDLGWTIIGRQPEKIASENVSMASLSMIVKEAEISDLWSLDALGIEDPSERKTKDELQTAAENHFLDTVNVDEEGRYVVHLPWIENHPPLGDNLVIAKKRLKATINKLKLDELFYEYDRVFQEWMSEGVIEEVSEVELNLPSHYLPHRHVVKEGSTTKIRPVFDASSKEKNTPSLNNCVEKGKNLIELIPPKLTQFRMNKLGIVADIRKAFLQISVFKPHREFLRFLWVDANGKDRIFRHKRVVFGVSCSPFLLGAVIKHHLRNILEKCEKNERDYSVEVIRQLSDSYYVDNCVTSVNDEQELTQFIQEATAVMNEAKFELRGWEYTHDTSEDSCSDENTKVLGLIWNKRLDTLEVNVKIFNTFDISLVTKRVILAAAHKLFDPVGVISPVLLLPKIMLQEICSMKTGWDEEVEQNMKSKFIKWFRELNLLQEVKIPRWLLNTSRPACHSLHVFCDASQQAYAAAVFVKTVSAYEVTVQLVQAKSRIAPLQKRNKRLTIPRLELLAATIGVRLCNSVIKEIHIPISSTTFWSDSTTVIAWITREEQWDIFVRNRVAEIRQHTSKDQWCHVPGIDNPADLPSRGCSVKKLIESSWWSGPAWLKESFENWPRHDLYYDEEEICQEKKKSITSTCNMICIYNEAGWYYKYFSKYKRIVRLIGWIIRFGKNARGQLRMSGELSPEETSYAENRVLYLIQQEAFTGLNDEKLSSLHPFLGADGLIRLKTKISHRDDHKDFCNPIVLPNYTHPAVSRLIFDVHKESSHAGVQTLMVLLRNNYWILGTRRSVTSVINKCITCKRYRAKKIEVQSPPLPVDRVREAKIFEIIGIDFAGPIYVKDVVSDSSRKCWICLFTCAVYRAVHLELTTSLSTDRCLQCLRRFISKRGRPALIYTDNGTNFTGSSNALSKVDWDKINKYSSMQKIRWKFNPPTAAWWGGWWERLVGLVKQILRRVLGKTSLDFEEMQTILSECEAIINSRPLTYVSANPFELVPLTPNMFLNEINEVGVPDIDMVEIMDFNKRLKYRNQLRNVLKQRFRSEYLGQLMLHSKRCSYRNIKVGDIVLVEVGNLKRLDWPLAIIEETIPGREGVVRLVRLKTSAGTLLRPVQRIYPLEVEFAGSEEKQHLQRVVEREHSVTVDPQVEEATASTDEASKQPEHQNERIRISKRGRHIKTPSRLVL